MAFIQPLLDRLFGKAEIQPESPEEQEQTLDFKAPEPPKPQPELQLPPDHPLYQLWNIYSAEKHGAPRPLFLLEGRETISDSEIKQELFRLQILINSTAKKRLELARPKQKKGEDPQKFQLDAQVVIFLPKNTLSAWLLVYPPVGGGKELDRADLTSALARERVSFGLDTTLLDDLPKNPKRYFRLFPIAWGEKPLHGTDGRIVELFPRSAERKFVVDENNRVDYTTLNLFQNVDEGGVICRVIPPTQGVSGRSVQDQEIPAKDGRAASVLKGRNTHLTESGDALVASISGQVEFSGRSFQVKPVLEIPGNVDFSTGNINFVGDVHIQGDICSGFTVRAMGNISVDGVVEACSVEAGGDLIVARGVQGDNQAIIRAQRNIFAKYLENCCVYVKQTLHTDCIINCDIYCDGDVEVRSGRMTIIGGTVRAAGEVNAGTIGSRTECRTEVILGGQPCGDLDRDLLIREAGDVSEEIEQLERQPDSPQKLNRLSKLRVKLIVAQKKLAELTQDEEQSDGESDQDLAFHQMLCDTVYPGTFLNIGGVTYQFDRKIFPCAATLADGEIHLV